MTGAVHEGLMLPLPFQTSQSGLGGGDHQTGQQCVPLCHTRKLGGSKGFSLTFMEKELAS